MFLFGVFSGLMNLISVWIDYMAYATMHSCQCLIVIFSAALEMLMLMLDWQSSGQKKTVITATDANQIMFWCMFGFNVVKLVVGIGAYRAFRKAYSE